MRLRPYGESGPLVASFEALENYLVSQGREWERYAWIKARALTGGRERELEAIVRPFVYRKYLDFGTLAAMRRLHAEVRREVERRELAEHVKLGPGGIREIEFVAQALQLVRGGRDPELAVRPTLEALARLAARRLLPADAARELAEAYLFLRRLEHRLQYLDDRQTHTLPVGRGRPRAGRRDVRLRRLGRVRRRARRAARARDAPLPGGVRRGAGQRRRRAVAGRPRGDRAGARRARLPRRRRQRGAARRGALEPALPEPAQGFAPALRRAGARARRRGGGGQPTPTPRSSAAWR